MGLLITKLTSQLAVAYYPPCYILIIDPDTDFIEHIKQLVALFDTENYYVLMSILSFTYETTPQKSSELTYEFF